MLRRNQGVSLARSPASRAATCSARSPPLIPEPPTPLPLFPPLYATKKTMIYRFFSIDINHDLRYYGYMNSTTQTTQQKIKAALLKTGLPVKEIEVYGSQIVITAWSVDAANQWAAVVVKFATLRGVIASMDYTEKNTNTVMLPSAHNVWRVFGRIN